MEELFGPDVANLILDFKAQLEHAERVRILNQLFKPPYTLWNFCGDIMIVNMNGPDCLSTVTNSLHPKLDIDPNVFLNPMLLDYQWEKAAHLFWETFFGSRYIYVGSFREDMIYLYLDGRKYHMFNMEEILWLHMMRWAVWRSDSARTFWYKERFE